MKTKYEWGKEYPTNGKRPDLPDDVWVSCKIGGEWDCDNDYSYSVVYWNWPNVQAFKVLDPRYKPADTSYLQSVSEISESKSDEVVVSGKPESNWFERGLLPKSGTRVELWIGGEYKEDVEFLCRRKFDLVFWRFINDSVDSAVTPTAELRPIRTHREKVIDAAEKGMLTSRVSNTQRKTIKRLYDLGMLVLPGANCNTK